MAAFSYGVRTAVRGLSRKDARHEGPHRAAGRRRRSGSATALWKLPVTQRFVRTVKDASARREAELREAVEVAVETDATSRAPRHAAWAETPDLEVEAGWDRSRDRGAGDPGIRAGRRRPGPLADARAGARAAARPHRRASSVGAGAPPPPRPPHAP